MKKRQLVIYEFIKEYIAQNKYSPSIREIGKAVGLKSPSTVHGHLNRLRENGYINFIDSRPRTIQIT